MSASDFILSVDIGPSATKAVLFDADLNQVSIVKKRYLIHAPHRGWSEQEPEVILDAVLGAIREMTDHLPESTHILGISFSSQLCSVLAVDMDGKPLTNSLIWSDTRSAEIAQSISQDPESQGIHLRTGCPIHAMYPLAKIRWLRQNVELPDDTRFVTIKEYVIHKLVGQWVVDWSVASATGLFDIEKHRWDETALSLLDITPANLSQLVSPGCRFTKWNDGMGKLIGLPPDAQLVSGGGDGPPASVGFGAYDSSSLAVNVGTGAAARLMIPEPEVDPEGRLWTYVVDEDMWVIGGSVSSGGIVYDWLLKNLFGARDDTEYEGDIGDVHERADRLASAVPPGAENLIFIPYLGGELSPDWRPLTRGGYFGLGLVHNRGHLVRAVLEGITRSIYRVSESIRSLPTGQFNEIRVTGGLSSSRTWLQIPADMFGSPILIPERSEGSARGAAMVAMIALGLRSDIQDFADMMVGRQRVDPRDEVRAYYEKQCQRFQEALEYARSSQDDWEGWTR